MKMIQLHHILIIPSLISLLCCRSLAQVQPPSPFDTSIVPSKLEGEILEVPIGGSRQITFTVTYIPQGVEYEAALRIDGRQVTIGRNSYEAGDEPELSIVSRGCEDSNKPTERCRLLQVTVHGRRQTHTLNGSTVVFVVPSGDLLNPHYQSDEITLRLIDLPFTEPPTTTFEPTTSTEVPMSTTSNIIVDPTIGQRRDQCQPLRAETIVPWVFVALLSALLFLTIIISAIVICNYKRRLHPIKPDVESGNDMAATEISHLPSKAQPPCDASSQLSSSKETIGEAERQPQS